jgi:hypothetical protein
VSPAGSLECSCAMVQISNRYGASMGRNMLFRCFLGGLSPAAKTVADYSHQIAWQIAHLEIARRR